jgi:hypothetical protein
LWFGAARPQSIINAIDLDDARIKQWFVVGFALAESR